MRAFLVVMMMVVAGPALACRGMSEADCRASRAQSRADIDGMVSEMMAENRASETNRRLRAIEREVSGIRDELSRRPVDDDWLPARRRY